MFRILCLLLSLAMAAPTLANTQLADPQDTVLLTLEGAITVKNSDKFASFDFDMLAAMPQTEIKTSTPWTDGVHTFAGPKLTYVLSNVGAQSAYLEAHALNDFTSSFSMEDWRIQNAIIAITHDGAPIPPRSKGPLWIMMPFDDHPDYKTEVILSRSVWGLHRIVVLP